jgi:hypothetical protein
MNYGWERIGSQDRYWKRGHRKTKGNLHEWHRGHSKKKMT